MTPVAPGRTAEVRRWLETYAPATTGMLAQKNLKLFAAGEPGNLRAVVGVRDQSVVYPVIPHPLTDEERFAGARLFAKLRDSVCVMGLREWVDKIEPLLSVFRNWRTVDYDFLSRPAEPPELRADFKITRGRARDATRLFFLQEGYEKEEVLFSPDEFQPLVSWLAFQKSLKEQLVCVLWDSGTPVAKAATNARFGDWAQIGGVYTLPSHRRRGLQKVLLAHLLESLRHERQGACLFVKKQNAAALGLYQALGFGQVADFRIGYWLKGAGLMGALAPNSP